MLYETHCASCHGTSGKGDGPLAQLQWPRPRDFTAGIFKYRATRGPIPSDTDLLQTMKMGIPGTPMPGWDLLSLNDWKSILSYVKTMIPSLANQKPGRPFEVPVEPKATPASIQMGRDLYVNRGCVSCHGSQGAGDGPAAAQLKDSWGNAITPRDLAHGLLKWGNTSKDIYRTLALGVPGTPMPAFEHTFTKDQLWALVHYIKSTQTPLPKDYDPSNPKRNLISVGATQTLPTDPKDAAWDAIPAAPIFLKPLWAQAGMTEWINVKALHDDKTATFLLTWVDTQRNGTADSSDGVALEFPVDSIPNAADVPFVAMGNAQKPVKLWLWKGDNITGFTATGINHMTPIKPLPAGISGKGVYDHGEWRVLMTLPLSSLGKGADTPKTGYMSIALWDDDAKNHPGPETFSEWMIYELR
jgi:DMSO reductase family type II enzyme heme b subunit